MGKLDEAAGAFADGLPMSFVALEILRGVHNTTVMATLVSVVLTQASRVSMVPQLRGEAGRWCAILLIWVAAVVTAIAMTLLDTLLLNMGTESWTVFAIYSAFWLAGLSAMAILFRLWPRARMRQRYVHMGVEHADSKSEIGPELGGTR